MSMRGAVRSLVEAYGQAVTLQRVETTYDPGTGGTEKTITDVPATAGPPHDFLTDEIDGTLIQRGDTVIDLVGDTDMTATGGGGDPEPQTSDKVVLDGKTWQIAGVGRVYAEGEVAAYRLHLQR